jgi:hypothetical protein
MANKRALKVTKKGASKSSLSAITAAGQYGLPLMESPAP